jgi:hypothetical protein
VNGPADAVAGQVGEIQRLGCDSLPREGGIAVERDGKDSIQALLAPAFLARTHAAHHDRVDGFEVARIAGEVDFDVLARRVL